MSFLYYLPQQTDRLTLDDLAAAGLRYAFESAAFGRRQCRTGPAGNSPGVIAAVGDANQIGYFPDKQTWRKVPGTQAWVGMYTQHGRGLRFFGPVTQYRRVSNHC